MNAFLLTGVVKEVNKAKGNWFVVSVINSEDDGNVVIYIFVTIETLLSYRTKAKVEYLDRGDIIKAIGIIHGKSSNEEKAEKTSWLEATEITLFDRLEMIKFDSDFFFNNFNPDMVIQRYKERAMLKAREEKKKLNAANYFKYLKRKQSK